MPADDKIGLHGLAATLAGSRPATEEGAIDGQDVCLH
jgi:hypothetical protein